MENLKWRSKAKIVACVHMIMLALILIVIIVGATILTVAANHVKSSSKGRSYSGKISDDNEESADWENKYEYGNKYQYNYDSKNESVSSALVMILWIFVAISVIMAVFEIWGAVMLLNATKTTTGANDCYRKCKNYIIITAIVLALVIIGTIFSKDMTSLVCGITGIVLRAVFIYVAYQFRQEVKPYALN